MEVYMNKDKKKFDPSKIDLAYMSDYNNLVTWAEEFGIQLKEKEVKRSQFRRIFAHIKKIQSDIESKGLQETGDLPVEIMKDIFLLKPKLAYTAGRHQNIKDVYEVVVQFVNTMKTVRDFTRFYDFIEATLAYHRYHGGKD